MFFHNNGRVVHYNGQSLLQWRSLRFDATLNPGDTLGIGWERLLEGSSGTAPVTGQVYFTLNGIKLDQALESVSGSLYPVIHIQKKNVRIKANFGSYKFLYAEGCVLQVAAMRTKLSCPDILVQARSLQQVAEVRENRNNEELGSMPFQLEASRLVKLCLVDFLLNCILPSLSKRHLHFV